MAELLLNELGASSILRPAAQNVAYDLLVGFSNKQAGVNTFAIEIKATERPVQECYRMRFDSYARLANSNIPSMLLVVDVKRNRMYYAWLTARNENKSKQVVSISLNELNEVEKQKLKKQLEAVKGEPAIAK